MRKMWSKRSPVEHVEHVERCRRVEYESSNFTCFNLMASYKVKYSYI